jgi:retron-type reverse transcriptase
VIDGVSSSFLEVTSGVPQGSVVGPLLFIIYVNEILNETTRSKTPMFADDSNLLQRDINSLQEWSVKWELSFNMQKCSMMRFTGKKNVMPAVYHLANEEI